jgi:hypothetical protein
MGIGLWGQGNRYRAADNRQKAEVEWVFNLQHAATPADRMTLQAPTSYVLLRLFF